jgi:hypothetical protein
MTAAPGNPAEDPEVIAIGYIARSLENLTLDQQDRVLTWAVSRFGSDRLWRLRSRIEEQEDMT